MNYYDEIKHELLNNEINRKIKSYSINKSDLNTYYNVGKMLYKAGKHYGENIIKKYSDKLVNEVNKKYNSTNLKRMRQFYQMIEKGALMGHQLTWSHYRELIPLKDINKINYYITLCENNPITRDELKVRIRSNEYERLPNRIISKTNNNHVINIQDNIKNPVIIRNSGNHDVFSEKVLQKIILEDIEGFMRELGNSFCFIGSEYKIKIGNIYNYIDILLFNYEYNCFVIIELKITELKKEHLGQIQVYMNYIDEKMKTENQSKTIGIIICKQDNDYVIKYCSDDRIISRRYELI